MPNWCWNTLVIQGADSVEVERFAEQNKGAEGPLSFNAMVPMPPWVNRSEKVEEVDMAEDTSWYGWRRKNWGSKWDLNEDVELSGSPYQLTYTFMTAWSPPLAWLETVAKAVPTLTLTLLWSNEDSEAPGALGSIALKGTG